MHRDLKPDNLFVVEGGHAKVLDFGLAKLTDPATGSASAGATMSPTMIGTMAGTIMGTAGYMAPEQVNGEPVDARADLFAFGCVLYEMLTGQRAFAGRSLHETLSQIVHDEPAPAEVPDIPMNGELGRILGKCLQKDLSKRYQGAADLAADLRAVLADLEAGRLEAATPGETAPTGPGRAAAPMGALLGVGLIAVAALAWGWSRGADRPPAERVEFEVVIPDDEVLPTGRILAFSPDGSRFIYQSRGIDMNLRLNVRGLGDLRAAIIPGTVDARAPAFSPDGEWVVAHDAKAEKLIKVPLSGGGSLVLADTTGATAHSSWGDDGTIVYENSGRGIWRIAANGGAPELLLEPGAGVGAYDRPFVMPGSRHVLLQANGDDGRSSVVVLDVRSGEVTTLIEDAGYPSFMPPSVLLFSRRGSLFAVSLDPASLTVTGTPIPVVREVRADVDGEPSAAVSLRGHIVYIPGETSRDDSLAWIDHDRIAHPIEGSAVDGVIYGVRLAPDASRVAVNFVRGAEGGRVEIFDIARQVYTLMDPRACFDPVWSRDGEVLLAICEIGSGFAVVRRAVDFSSPVETIWETEEKPTMGSVTADGDSLLLSHDGTIWRLPIDGSGPPTALIETTASTTDPVLSPDGRWLAYRSNMSGEPQLYVTPYPGPGATVQVTAGLVGGYPSWARDGSRLYWVVSPGTLMRVDFDGSGARPILSAPIAEYSTVVTFSPFGRQYAISDDGERVLASPRQVGVGDPALIRRLRVVLNWADEVRRQLAAQR